jgi:hypothetical protein
MVVVVVDEEPIEKALSECQHRNSKKMATIVRQYHEAGLTGFPDRI